MNSIQVGLVCVVIFYVTCVYYILPCRLGLNGYFRLDVDILHFYPVSWVWTGFFCDDACVFLIFWTDRSFLHNHMIFWTDWSFPYKLMMLLTNRPFLHNLMMLWTDRSFPYKCMMFWTNRPFPHRLIMFWTNRPFSHTLMRF